MKFTDTLKESEAKATEGEMTFSEYGNRNGAYQRLIARKSGIQKPWIGNINKEPDAKLVAFLRNHAKEIINLVEAAELIERVGCMGGDGEPWCKGDAHSIYCPAGIATKALAALNKDQS